MREAVLNLVDQKDYMQAVAGDEKYWKTCAALFVCGTPFASDAGADALFKGAHLDKAKALIKEAGYKGEKIVLLSATDQPIVQNQALVTQDLLKRLGLNVELQASDWGTLITRRASKEPIDKGGWSIFHTWTSAPDMLSPAVNNQFRGNGDKAWFGWPNDPKMEDLVSRFANLPAATSPRDPASNSSSRTTDTCLPRTPYRARRRSSTPQSSHPQHPVPDRQQRRHLDGVGKSVGLTACM